MPSLAPADWPILNSKDLNFPAFTTPRGGIKFISPPTMAVGTGTLTFSNGATVQGSMRMKIGGGTYKRYVNHQFQQDNVRKGREFEDQIARVLRFAGWTNIVRRWKWDSMTYDIAAYSPKGDFYVFECKGGRGLARTDTIKKAIGAAMVIKNALTTVLIRPRFVIVTTEISETPTGKILLDTLCANCHGVYKAGAFETWCELV